jgi:hypothetical protein
MVYETRSQVRILSGAVPGAIVKASYMYGIYTFSLVLLLAAPGRVGYEATERGFQILAGIGLLVVGLAVVHALGTWLSKRDPQPELA